MSKRLDLHALNSMLCVISSVTQVLIKCNFFFYEMILKEINAYKAFLKKECIKNQSA